MTRALPLHGVLFAVIVAALGCADDSGGDAFVDDDASAAAGGEAHEGGVAHDASTGRDAGAPATDAGMPARDAGGPPRDASAQDAARDASGSSDARVEDAAGTGDGRRSEGCGKAKSGSGDFEGRTLRAGDRERRYYVRVPTSYQASRAYALVFRWHGSGGDGLSGGLDIEYAAGDDAIIVGADGLQEEWGAATESEDLALFDAMYQQLTQEYCVELGRVFSYGFSAGGGMTNMLSCKRGDKLRGSAAIAGYVWGDQSACGPAVAAWFLHDADDKVVTVEMGRQGRALALERNGCGNTAMPAANGCVSYTGCKAGYPVIWCETQGRGHNIAADTAPAQVWAFFEALSE